MTPFASIIMPQYRKTDRDLYRTFEERWCPTIRIFHLFGDEMGITPLDFTMIIGVANGEGDPLMYDNNCMSYKFIKKILPLLKEHTKNSL